MGWVTQKTLVVMLTCQCVPVRFDICVEAHSTFFRMGRLANQTSQNTRRSLQNLHEFLPAVEIKNVIEDWFVLAGEKLADQVRRNFVEERLRELLNGTRLQVRWLRFAAIKAEVVRC